MKQKFSMAMSLAVILAMLLTSLVLADAATDQSININNGDSSTASLSVLVKASALHCPPGGDMKALEVAFSNASSSGPWTVVHAAGTDWPGTDTDGCTNSGAGIPANFAWTLASGAGGTRTVYARFKHAQDEVSAQDVITYSPISNTPPTLTVPDDVTVEGNTAGGAYVSFDVSATDAEDNPDPAPTCSAASGDFFPLGETIVNCSVTDSGLLSDSDSFKVTVVDTTDPLITFVGQTPAANSNGWNNTDVTLEWSCSDTVGVVSATVTQTLTDDGADQSATGTCEDLAGNTASDKQSGINIDQTAPAVTATANPGPNANGWNNTDVVVSYSCDDGTGSGADALASDLGNDTLAASGTASGTCVDLAGNSASDSYDALIDKDAPVVTATANPGSNANGWNNTDVVVSYSCDDGTGSGVDALASDLGNDTLTASGTASGTCVDLAGNSASDSYSALIDKTAPVFAACPAGGPFILNSGPQAVGPITVDADISGLYSSTLSGSVDTSSIGVKTVNFSALDNAGNPAAKSCDYSVIYNWNGFFQPIDKGVLNTTKAGSSIPVKFSLSGNQGLSIFMAGYPSSKVVACGSTAEDAIETTVTAGSSSLSYDALADQYIYVWKTDKAWVGTCRTLVVKLTDGTTHTANFKFK